ncbi:MAG: serine/threonine-protein phosphatase [Oscillospiraceae bacterium]|nr:serine/threonine-protein phosphatase [Oscillospiraceae bacterium]
MSDGKRLEQNLCWEIGIVREAKHGEAVCGDSVVVKRSRDRVRLVLADGLGSGIQAAIASTLTSTLVSQLTEAGLSVGESMCTVEKALPVTKKHNLAYSTFTLASTEGREVRLVQYDNPPAVFMRDGVSLTYPTTTCQFGEKTVLESRLTMKGGDILILFSDGISEAGRGVTTYSGWDRGEMEDYLSRNIGPEDDARRVAAEVVSAAQALDLYEFHDDTTVAVLRLRERLTVDLRVEAEDGSLLTEKEGRCASPTPENLCVTCGRETIRETISLLERYLHDGMMSLRMGEEQDAASALLTLLTERASDVRLRLSAAVSGVGEKAEESDTAELTLRLRQLLEEAGKTVTLHLN